jgi:NAD(P)-dependent dehydrogenase (short-subunit alcohol dehydrogenase family)
MRMTTKLMLAAAAGAGTVAAARALARRRRRIDFDGRSVVISGGSRGLGLELARILAQEGARLALLARDPAELDDAHRILMREVPGCDVRVLPCDVTDPERVDWAVREIMSDRESIDVLINAAGIIQVGPAETMSLEDFEQALAVHLWGPLHLMNAVIPHMRDRRGGRIVNIASVGGRVAVPHLAPYVTSKFALVGLSDALRAELAPEGIHVTTVCPGLMRTGSHVNARFKGNHEAEFAWFAAGSAAPLVSMSSNRAARQIVRACRHGDPHLTVGMAARAAIAANAVLPNLTGELTALFDRLLPRGDSREARTGWDSQSRAAPSLLTRRSDRAITRNNEGPQLSRSRS